jgi:hypothetical protein
MVIKSRRMVGRDVARMGEMRNAYSIFPGKSEGIRPLGRSRYRWEDNIRIDLTKMGGKICTGCIWLRVCTHGGPLSTP